MKATSTPPYSWIDTPGKSVSPRGINDHVGSEELEVRAGEAVTVEVTVDGMRSAVGHPQQLLRPFVELVVAHAVDVETDEVHRLDRRLVMEQRRDQRRSTDEVTGRHEDRVLGLGFGGGDVRRQEVGTTRLRRTNSTTWRCCRGSR